MRMRNALALSVTLAVVGMAPAALAAPKAFAAAAAQGSPPGSVLGVRGVQGGPLGPPFAAAAARGLLVRPFAPGPLRDVGNGGGAKPAPALPSRIQPECGDGKSPEFPIGARIRGGPAVYRSGGGPQTWYLDLTNTTARTCRAVHPVVVFTDRDHVLRSTQLVMDFVDKGTGRTHAVSLEQTDQDEVVAVFDGGGGAGAGDGTPSFAGFTLAPGGTVTVTVHLAFTPDTAPGEVVADAALVQRKGDDGDWVGESGRYRFSVERPEEPTRPEAAAGSLASTGGAPAALTPARLSALAGVAAAFAATGGALVVAGRRLRRTG
ncbi:hypothetical protein [Streptomyces sp. NPDC093225]|uniref:hypothetical protein n=1 Tax=Streptomyces sp. NPDC093225 TaxID=3366034 RepID=UPI0038184617